MLGRHDPASIERALNGASPPPFPPASDREVWDAARRAFGEVRVSKLLAVADVRTDVPGFPATLYLEFSRAGAREG